MSYLTGAFIQWGSNPWITFHELTKIHYLFFRISCHSIWPISHLHTIPLERCAFLYALVTNTSMSFPYLFIRSLIEIHKSSSTAHGLPRFYSSDFITFRFRGYSWYMSCSLGLCEIKNLFCFTCIFHICVYVFVKCYRNIQVDSVVLLFTIATDR